MSQKLAPKGAYLSGAEGKFENVGENWVLYDTILIGGYVASLQFAQGWFTSYAAAGAATTFPFFNVRNRNHGLAYNNQDTRDQLPYPLRIFTIGVRWFEPDMSTYSDTVGVPTGARSTLSHMWSTELPKHAYLSLQVQQDERLRIPTLLAPPGYGAVGGGVGQGDPESAWGQAGEFINPGVWNFTQGVSELTNKWAFRNPVEVPRRANLTVTITLSEWARQFLQAQTGPHQHPFRATTGDAFEFKYSLVGLQVVLGGQRLVQQRDQYHA